MHILSCKFATYELNLTSGTQYNKVNDISVPFCWIYAILINRAAMKYNVMSIPTVIIFEKGEVKNKNVGFMPEEVMREYLHANL